MFKPSYLDKNPQQASIGEQYELLVILRQRDIEYVHIITPEYYAVTETTPGYTVMSSYILLTQILQRAEMAIATIHTACTTGSLLRRTFFNLNI